LVELGHHALTDLARLDLVLSLLHQLRLQPVHDRVDPLGGDGPLLTGAQEAVQDLLAAERLAPAVLLYHEERRRLQGLVGREPPVAGEAFPPAADGLALLGRAGIDDLVLEMAARGTLHCITPAVSVSSAPVSACRTVRAPVTVSPRYSPSTTRSGSTTRTGEPEGGIRVSRKRSRSMRSRSSSIASSCAKCRRMWAKSHDGSGRAPSCLVSE